MSLQQLAPSGVSERHGLRRRADDVGEEDGREDSVGFDDVPVAAVPDLPEKLFDGPGDRIRLDPPSVVVPG